MALVSIVPLLQEAQAGRYALPLFLTPEMLAAEGTVAALEDLRAPAAVGVYAGWIERPDARAFSAFLRALAEEASVPIALMLDHGANLEQCIRAIRYGFTDVMYDGSALPLAENIATTRTIVQAAHAVGVGVEAELGHVGSGSDYAAYGARRAGFTEPGTVAAFVEATGVDVLAVAFGSAHGVYQGEPQLDLALLGELRAATDIPLAMHGGSGLSREQFQGAIAAGISKINVFTELGLTTGQRLCAHAAGGQASYFSFQEVVRGTFRERCADYLAMFGAAGKAAATAAAGGIVVSIATAPFLSGLPEPAERNMAVRVMPAGERALRQGHPWLFERAIRSQAYQGRPGDLAVAFDAKGRFLAVGLYDPRSPIRVKVLQHGTPARIDEEWFLGRFAAAAALRAPLAHTDTTGYRLVHGENDGLPGLVADRYDRTLVLKLYTPAWIPHLRHLLPALEAVQPFERLVLRLGRLLEAYPEDLYGLADGQVLWGPEPDGPVAFTENGLHLEANVLLGQKTGFFFDQRENRARVEGLAEGQSTLNVFAYTGGFSLYAARGGAPTVLSTDLSIPALEAAERHFRLNLGHPRIAAAQHTTLAGDAFAVLDQLSSAGRRFGLVIIDPPSFAQSQPQIPGALAAYARLATLGLGVLAPEGTLVMSSCSSRVSAEAFFACVLGAAAEAGRPLREIARTGHPLDHPIGFPEGAYLKCLYATG